eukprot:3947411-Alexandrium_andersonii.AAC.1
MCVATECVVPGRGAACRPFSQGSMRHGAMSLDPQPLPVKQLSPTDVRALFANCFEHRHFLILPAEE